MDRQKTYVVNVKGRVLPTSNNGASTRLYEFKTANSSRTECYFSAYVFIASVLKGIDTCGRNDFCTDRYFLESTKSGGFKDTVKVEGKEEPAAKAHLICNGDCTFSEWLINVTCQKVIK